MNDFTKQIGLTLILLLITVLVQAQTLNQWVGPATGGLWDVDANWKEGHIPTSAEIAEFASTSGYTDMIITGSNAVAPAGLRIWVNTLGESVTLDGDFNIGNANTTMANKGTLYIEVNAKLIVASGRTLTIETTAENTLPEMDIDGQLEVEGTINVPVTNDGRVALDIRHETSFVSILDGGLINIEGGTFGFYMYHGSAAYNQTADFVVEAGGTLNISGTTNIPMLIRDGYSLENNGTINVTSDLANFGVKVEDDNSSLANKTGGVLNLTSTNATSGRSIEQIAGLITNAGTMNFIGGVAYRNTDLDAVFTNEIGGIINLEGENQIRLNNAATAIFTNNGLISTNGSGFVSNLNAESGQFINNAFFYFGVNSSGNGIGFPNEANGSLHVNNGVLLNGDGVFKVDPSGSSSFNIGIVSEYEWYEESTNETIVGTNDTAGDIVINPTGDCDYQFYTVYGSQVVLDVINYDFGSTCDGDITVIASNGSVVLNEETVGADPVNYEVGAVLMYTAVPDLDYEFVNWTFENGAEASVENPLNHTVIGDETITANFTLQTFEITIASPSNGIVTKDGNEVDENSVAYEIGSIQVFTAVPNEGYTFDRWSFSNGADDRTENPLSYFVASEVTITAEFSIVTNDITISQADNGTVTLDDVDQEGTTNSYALQQELTYAAVPNEGYDFVNWTFSSGADASADNPLSHIVIGDETITAHFASKAFDVTIANAENGNVTNDGNEVDNTTISYTRGSIQMFTAVPEDNYVFDFWTFSDDDSREDTSNPLSYTVESEVIITANFSIITSDISIVGAENGSVTLEDVAQGGTTTTYDLQHVLTYTAIPNDGFEFVNWTYSTGAAPSTDNPLIHTVVGDETITANFKVADDQGLSLGLDDSAIYTAKVYPNLIYSGEIVNIELGEFSAYEETEVTIVNMQGQLIYREKYEDGRNALQVTTNGSWVPGLYLINILNDRGLAIDKLIVK